MRGYIPLLLALSASYTTITALPQPRIVRREAAAKPKYSVVPLEPGDDDPASGGLGNGDGNGSSGGGKGKGDGSSDEDGDGIVTVIQTVVKSRKPVTQVVTKTEEPSTVTAPGKTVTKAVPTTVSIIDMDEGPVTQTVTVVPESSTSKPKAPKESKPAQESDTTTEKPKPTAQTTPKSLSSAAAPGVTSQPQPEPQSKPEPKPKSPTTIESPQTTEDSPSTTCDTNPLPPFETVAQPPPAIESSAASSNPTTLLTLTTQGAGAPKETVIPSPDSPVAPIPSQETFVDGPATQGESWSTATVPYVPPVAPTTLLTSTSTSTSTSTTTTTTSDVQNETPEPISPSETQDDGVWHTSYPSWNGTVLSI
ncbi:hypothetical protein FSARC_9216 [Fusarium sarcochroum]|uniref:Uncharacterized protein n=1 Tax=Fusarium sarcochroum TaxID=1208366 RepID=A0A8H4TRA4_9HYPO|nr:hypothetical protein FSARC_9216 [Fusarium sarcochroum]